MSRKVRIRAGFAAGLEGEAKPLAGGWEVTIVYPEGFVEDDGYCPEDLGGVKEILFYYGKELEFLDPAE